MIASDDRKTLHRQIAAYYEALQEKTIRPEVLAWHHQEAGAIDKALLYWIKACRAALARSSHREAVAFANNGIAKIQASSDEYLNYEIELQLVLGSAWQLWMASAISLLHRLF
jgi:predicted ATPase